MGGRQSKRSVDITTTPKKEGTEDQQQPLDGRLGHIEEGEGDTKPAANGAPTVSATDIQEEVVQNGSEQIADGEIESAAQASEAETTITGEKEKEEDKKKEKKEKVKKKWSFRSISFSKKDKSKPPREDRNGGISKEEVAEVNEEKVEASEVAATSEPALAPQQELGSEVANDSEVTEKMEEITAAKVKTETEEPAAVEALPVQVEESSKEQTPASQSEPVAVSAPVPASEEVPPPLPASPPPTEIEATSVTEPQKVDEIIAQVESAPAEPKDLIDVPGVSDQPASPIPTPKVEEGVVAKVEEPETPAPIEEPKTEDAEVPKPVETQVPSLVEEKTESPIDAVEPGLPVPQVEEQVPAPIEIPAQVEPEPSQTSDIKTPETHDSVQAFIETPQSQTIEAAVEE